MPQSEHNILGMCSLCLCFMLSHTSVVTVWTLAIPPVSLQNAVLAEDEAKNITYRGGRDMLQNKWHLILPIFPSEMTWFINLS